MADQFLIDQLANVKARIDHYNTAILAFDDPTVQAFDLDDGQSRQRVTRQDLDLLHGSLAKMWEEYKVLNAQVNGGTGLALYP